MAVTTGMQVDAPEWDVGVAVPPIIGITGCGAGDRTVGNPHIAVGASMPDQRCLCVQRYGKSRGSRAHRPGSRRDRSREQKRSEDCSSLFRHRPTRLLKPTRQRLDNNHIVNQTAPIAASSRPSRRRQFPQRAELGVRSKSDSGDHAGSLCESRVRIGTSWARSGLGERPAEPDRALGRRCRRRHPEEATSEAGGDEDYS